MEANIIEFRERPSGARQGFADVELPELGLTVKDVVVFRSYHRAWCKMPARRVAVDDQTVLYHPYVAFSPGVAEAVEQAICEAVEQHKAGAA